MSTRLKLLRKGYRENRASALAALGLLLFAIGLLVYELLREPPQYLEFHGFYEGLRTVTHGGRYGSHKELYLKVQGLDRPIKAVDGCTSWWSRKAAGSLNPGCITKRWRSRPTSPSTIIDRSARSASGHA